MKRPNRLWIAALFLGWAFDFLFWKHNPGISFAIYVLLCLGTGFLVLGLEGIKPSWRTLLLLLPALFFAAVTFLRLEPMTTFLAGLFTLLSMSLLAASCLGGRWPWYSLADYAVNGLKLLGGAISGGLLFAMENKKRAAGNGKAPGGQPASRSGWKRFWAVLRGVLIALPVVAIFAALLSSADAIFAQRLDEFIELFRLERLPEYIFRGIYILCGAYLLAGVLLYAAGRSRDAKLIGEDKPLLPPFLGFTEAAVVLGAVAALFAAFVAIQFQYFFGGQANIRIDGYTYAEYARRGFVELNAVAFFSLLLFLGLNAVTKRAGSAQRWGFSGLGIVLVALVAVMLASSFQRLQLYEAAYGFSRLRTYTHAFIIWMGVLLAVVVVLEILRRERFFALAAFLVSIGFAATLPVLNVDVFIVRQNLARAARTGELDVAYLASLSADAVPALAAAYASPDLPAAARQATGAALVCWQWRAPARSDESWRAFHFSRWGSEAALQDIDLSGYELVEDEWSVQVVTPGGERYDCFPQYTED